MKTDDLIDLLAADARTPDRTLPKQRFIRGVGIGWLVALVAVLALLGVRNDIEQALRLPMFWIKMLFPASIAAIGLLASWRLAHPGRRAAFALPLVGMLIGLMWTAAVLALTRAAPDQQASMVFGETWAFCLVIVPALSIPVFLGMWWAMKGLAPTRLSLAGGSAGLVAGAAGATVYALHCPELDAPFIAVWYVLGMTIPAVAGSLLGRYMLRW